MKNSQHGIEKYLELLFDEPGTFLEIGCWDGTLISQTNWLEKEKGWKGVCVDPFPRGFEDRTCLLVTAAIGKVTEFRKFMKVSIDRRDNGDVSYFSGFVENVKSHIKLIEKHCDYEIVDVQAMTFDDLILSTGLPSHVDFLSVDTEGSELEIFQNIDFSKYSFGLIVFEHNEDAIPKKGIGDILEKNGYSLLKELRCDDIYIKRVE